MRDLRNPRDPRNRWRLPAPDSRLQQPVKLSKAILLRILIPGFTQIGMGVLLPESASVGESAATFRLFARVHPPSGGESCGTTLVLGGGARRLPECLDKAVREDGILARAPDRADGDLQVRACFFQRSDDEIVDTGESASACEQGHPLTARDHGKKGFKTFHVDESVRLETAPLHHAADIRSVQGLPANADAEQAFLGEFHQGHGVARRQPVICSQHRTKRS